MQSLLFAFFVQSSWPCLIFNEALPPSTSLEILEIPSLLRKIWLPGDPFLTKTLGICRSSTPIHIFFDVDPSASFLGDIEPLEQSALKDRTVKFYSSYWNRDQLNLFHLFWGYNQSPFLVLPPLHGYWAPHPDPHPPAPQQPSQVQFAPLQQAPEDWPRARNEMFRDINGSIWGLNTSIFIKFTNIV